MLHATDWVFGFFNGLLPGKYPMFVEISLKSFPFADELSCLIIINFEFEVESTWLSSIDKIKFIECFRSVSWNSVVSNGLTDLSVLRVATCGCIQCKERKIFLWDIVDH